MSGFSADWLALREPADEAARSNALVDRLQADVVSLCGPGPLRIVDLGSGTGANLRYLASRMAGPQHWTLLEQDPALLAVLPERLQRWASVQGLSCAPLEPPPDAGPPGAGAGGLSITGPGRSIEVRWQAVDLAASLAPVRAARPHLITASALLDLVSADWLGGLCRLSAEQGAALLAVLSYDGRMFWTPPDARDVEVQALFNRHQTTDKGFGPALGPGATLEAQRQLTALGYRVYRAPSDWVLDQHHAPLQTELLHGCHAAAVELAPGRSEALSGWLEHRLQQTKPPLASGRVGHEDLLALPPGVFSLR